MSNLTSNQSMGDNSVAVKRAIAWVQKRIVNHSMAGSYEEARREWYFNRVMASDDGEECLCGRLINIGCGVNNDYTNTSLFICYSCANVIDISLESIFLNLMWYFPSNNAGFSKVAMSCILHHELMTNAEMLQYLDIHNKKKLTSKETALWLKINQDIRGRISDFDREHSLAMSQLCYESEVGE